MNSRIVERGHQISAAEMLSLFVVFPVRYVCDCAGFGIHSVNLMYRCVWSPHLPLNATQLIRWQLSISFAVD